MHPLFQTSTDCKYERCYEFGFPKLSEISESSRRPQRVRGKESQRLVPGEKPHLPVRRRRSYESAGALPFLFKNLDGDVPALRYVVNDESLVLRVDGRVQANDLAALEPVF